MAPSLLRRLQKTFTINHDKPSKRLIGFKSEDRGLVELQQPELYQRYNPRYYEDLVPLFSRSYRQNVVITSPRTEAYAGAESLLAPNVTVFPTHWPGREGQRIFANSMGHSHGRSHMEYVELYMVADGLGGVLIDTPDAPFVELILCQPGDFVPIASNCNMTLMNINLDAPLVLLDISGPEHISSKVLQQEIGPLLLVSSKADQFCIELNAQYIGRADGFGVAEVETDDLRVCLSVPSSQIVARWLSAATQARLHQLGIQVKAADNEYAAKQLAVPLESLTVENLRKVANSPLYQAVCG